MTEIPQAINKINIKGGLGKSYKGGSWFTGILWGLIKNWRVSITTIMILLIFIQGINQSIEEKTPIPLIYEVGGRVVSADEVLYQRLTNLETPSVYDGTIKGFFKTSYNTFFYYFDIFSSLWFIYFMWWFIYRYLIKPFDESRMLRNILIAGVILIVFQMMFGLSLFILDHAETTLPPSNVLVKEVSVSVIPFKGLGLFFFKLPELSKPLYNFLVESPPVPIPIEEVTNATANITSMA